MRDIYKTILHDVFQCLIIVSIPMVLTFFWPNHDERLMKFICFQILSSILLAFSFLFNPKRIIDNAWPAFFLFLSFINLMTHNMSDSVSVGLGFIVPTITCFYVLSNHIHTDIIPVLKKTIVITCLINCALFLLETCGFNLVFDIGPQSRASGFMCYPATFAMLCAISIFLAWEWKKWLCFPIGICLYLSHEYSVIAGILLAICMPIKWRFNKHCLILIPIFSIISLFIWHLWPHIQEKAIIRWTFLKPIIIHVWARPLDGWGIGQYRMLGKDFFGFNRGNWSEMHCEPLDLFFCMGIIGFSCVWGWIRSIFKGFSWNIYTRSMLVIFVTSLFHSPFHFGDSLYLIIVVLTLFEVEKYEHTTSYQRSKNLVRTTEDRSRCCNPNETFANSL